METNIKPNISDRITEAYFGSSAFGDNKKYTERVHWVCSNAKGESVLDVGCSQGIVPILLAREGFKVLGLDVDEKSINYAKEFFSDEKETTLKNVEFVCDNFMNREFKDMKYDTVVCTEVLEHLTVPERFVEKIRSLVKENGVAIFTVPFGVNDFFDHKKIYYALDLIEVVSPYFGIEEIKFFGHWIGVICKHKTSEIKEVDLKQILKQVESTFLEFEYEYKNNIKKIDGNYKQLNEKLKLETNRNNEISEYLKEEKKRSDILISKYEKELDLKIYEINILKQAITVNENKTKNNSGEINEIGGTINDMSTSLKIINEKYRLAIANEAIYKKRWEESQAELAKQKNALIAIQSGKLFRLIILPTYKISNKFKKFLKKKSKSDIVGEENKANTINSSKTDKSNQIEKKAIKAYKDLNVLVISDEFTGNNLKNEFNVIRPTPENFIEILDNNDIDFFLCESAWQGNEKTWEHKVSDVGFRDNTILKKLVRECKKRSIPTAFWNKEDPFHFDSFINSAKEFDYVFTTDSSVIPKYKKKGCKNVFWSPFFFDPKIFNPIKEYDVENKIVFAGAYYPKKFSERGEFMENMPEVFGDYGLTIYDRNFDKPDNVNQFPESFKKYIVGTLAPTEIKKAYKGYRVCLNTNSIVDSETMFARRVVEVLACNTPMLSSTSNAINNLFEGIIVATNNKDELKKQTELLFNNDELYSKRKLGGVREAFAKYTTEKVIKSILRKSNFEFKDETIGVDVISYCKDKESLSRVVEMFNMQVATNKHLHIFIEYYDGYEADYNNYNTESISVYPMEYFKNIEDKNEYFKSQFVTIFDAKFNYDEHYVQDFMNAFNYLEEDVIVTRNEGEEYTFVDRVNNELFAIENSKLSLEDIKLALINEIELTGRYKTFNINKF